MPVYYVLCVIICLYFFRDNILGVFASNPGHLRKNLQVAIVSILVSFFPVLNSLLAFAFMVAWVWKKLFNYQFRRRTNS